MRKIEVWVKQYDMSGLSVNLFITELLNPLDTQKWECKGKHKQYCFSVIIKEEQEKNTNRIIKMLGKTN